MEEEYSKGDGWIPQLDMPHKPLLFTFWAIVISIGVIIYLTTYMKSPYFNNAAWGLLALPPILIGVLVFLWVRYAKKHKFVVAENKRIAEENDRNRKAFEKRLQEIFAKCARLINAEK